MKQKRRLILVGRYHIIEPLGILYLAGLARSLGWEVRVVLIEKGDFDPLYNMVELFQPKIVGFSIWTGYHLQAFAACDRVLRQGVKVAIGGPHATYFTAECEKHSTWTVRGEGFRALRKILAGEIGEGPHFDGVRLAEGFPMPDRDVVYRKYPALANNKIRSSFCSLGCPFTCGYCYAPSFNDMYGGFALMVRPVDDLIAEAKDVVSKWGAEMFYFQDDIFGFNLKWLREFAERWPREVGVPWHCQIRLELTRSEERLDLFVKGGCSGITLAIESGNDFLRRFVLRRAMPDELIVEGIRKIQERGLALRTEQILGVPFSDIKTDLETLELNGRLAPDMAWTSILAPYLGTAMGDLTREFGLYGGTNDDLSETFFDKSVLRHVDGGYRDIKLAVETEAVNSKDNPLLRMYARKAGGLRASVHMRDRDNAHVGEIGYLPSSTNRRYCGQTVALQRIFNWLAKVPEGHTLGGKFVELEPANRTWKKLGRLTHDHLQNIGCGEKLPVWTRELAHEMGLQMGELPERIAQNPWYFTYFPSSGEFASRVVQSGTLQNSDDELFGELGTSARHHLFDVLYKAKKMQPAISSN